MGSCKRPCNKAVEGGRLQELSAGSLAYVVGYQYIVLTLLLVIPDYHRGGSCEQVNEPLALMSCITLKLIKR